MKPKIFNFDYRTDPLAPAKDAINSVASEEDFLEAVEDCIKGIGFGIIEGCGCLFPENGDDFEGVACFLADDEIILTEEEFFSLLKEACQKYIKIYPNRRDELRLILRQKNLR